MCVDDKSEAVVMTRLILPNDNKLTSHLWRTDQMSNCIEIYLLTLITNHLLEYK